MENEKRTIMDPGLSLNETLQKDNSEREQDASGPSNEEYVNEHPSLKSLI